MTLALPCVLELCIIRTIIIAAALFRGTAILIDPSVGNDLGWLLLRFGVIETILRIIAVWLAA